MIKKKIQRLKATTQKSIIHIYTGDGKGKTTAALGLAIRAIGAGKKVALVQFMKKGNFSEIKAIDKYKLPIDIFQFGAGFYKILDDKKPKSTHQKAAQKAFEKSKALIESQKYDLIILDEINVAISSGLIDVNDVIKILITNNSILTSLVLTGRNAHPKLIRLADLVTNMKKNKHYFDKGWKAQKGIEY